MRHEAGLDQPVVVRYLIWLGGVLHGDFGYSLVSGRPDRRRGPAAPGPELHAGIGRGSDRDPGRHSVRGPVRGQPVRRIDYILSSITILVISTPTFVLGLIALFVFGVSLHWLPVGELFTFGKENDPIDRFAHLVLPATILGLANAAPLVRYTRASMLDTLSSEYITTARSKGLASHAVIVRHGLRNALIPIITLVAILLPQLIAGAVITETLFNWPGLGQLSVKAASDRDPALMMGVVLLIGVAVLIMSIVADMLYAIADPRIRFDSSR